MTTKFFPRDKLFWLCHAGVLALVIFVQLAYPFVFGELQLKNFIDKIWWIPLYSFIVLFFRWHYKEREHTGMPIGRLIAAATIYAGVSGFVLAAVSMLGMDLYAWLFSTDISPQIGVPGWSKFFRGLFFYGLFNQMYVCAWIFIYTSVSINRRARGAEIANLHLLNSLKEAQLSSLSNQLNPHFLFNSLNNIRFMIHENAQQADHMITSLSDILRYSLETGKHEKVSLGQELEVINQYVAIVKIQMEDRLDFLVSAPQVLHACLMPPMVLQMLVENAVKHGLDQLHAGGNLTVNVFEHAGQLVLDVSNDVPAQISAESNSPRNNIGIGLANITRRLHLLYGDRATLNISQHDQTFQATMTLPKEHVA